MIPDKSKCVPFGIAQSTRQIHSKITPKKILNQIKPIEMVNKYINYHHSDQIIVFGNMKSIVSSPQGVTIPVLLIQLLPI